MSPILWRPRLRRAVVMCLLCILADSAGSQSGQNQPTPAPQGDVFNSGGGRGDACDTNNWIHAHGNRWDRCQYERDCPSLDTKRYGEPDRFPANDPRRMNGYVRCAVDPCTPGGAQCWGRRPGSDTFNSNGAPGEPKRPGVNPTPEKPSPPVRIPGGYDPCANPVPAPGCPDTPPRGSKTVKRVPGGPSGGGGTGDAGTLVKAIDRCIREKGELSYYASPTAAVGGPDVTYDGTKATVAYNPAKLNAQKPYIRAYFLAGAFADHIANLERQRFNKVATPQAKQQQRDYVIGFIAHCLRDGNALPMATGNDDPRLQFQDYLFLEGGNVPLAPATVLRAIDFDQGWKDDLMGFRPEMRHN